MSNLPTDEQGRSGKANACCYRHFCKAESAAYLFIAQENEKLRAENVRLHHERAEDVDRMERAAEAIEREQSALTETHDAWTAETTRRQSVELELDAALMQLQGLKDLLSQAVDDIESWSGYASTYFHEKHDLKGCLARYRAALDVPAESLCDHGIPVNSPSACPTCHSEQPIRRTEP